MHIYIYIYIYNAQNETKMKFSCIIPKLGKVWHGLSRNQGATGKHDE